MSGKVDVRRLVLAIVQLLVDQHDAIAVESIEEADGTLLKLKVAPEDIGKVIGKQGRMARSIRTILSGISMKTQHRIALDINEGPRELLRQKSTPRTNQ